MIIIIVFLLFFIVKRIIKYGVENNEFYLIHIGLLLILIFLLIDLHKEFSVKIKLHENIENNIGYSSENNMVQLPYSLELIKLDKVINKIGNGSHISANLIMNDRRNEFNIKIDINKPFSFSNSDMYLNDYHCTDKHDADECTLLIVYNPFKYCVLAGIFIMMLGCLKMFGKSFSQNRPIRKELTENEL